MPRGILKMLKTGICLPLIRYDMPPNSAVTDQMLWLTVRLAKEILAISKLLMESSICLWVEVLRNQPLSGPNANGIGWTKSIESFWHCIRSSYLLIEYQTAKYTTGNMK